MFHSRDKHVFPKVYKTYVRPHVEVGYPVWTKTLSRGIKLIEKLQKRFVRMVSGLSGTMYEENLLELGILSLRDFDLIESCHLADWCFYRSYQVIKLQQLQHTHITCRVAPDTDLAGYPANFFAEYLVSGQISGIWPRYPTSGQISG